MLLPGRYERTMPSFFLFFFLPIECFKYFKVFAILTIMEPLTFHVGQSLKMGYITNSPGLWGLLQTPWRHNSWCIWPPLSFQHHFHHWEKKDKNEVGYTPMKRITACPPPLWPPSPNKKERNSVKNAQHWLRKTNHARIRSPQWFICTISTWCVDQGLNNYHHVLDRQLSILNA